jgi:hypothetical protein
VIPYENRLKAVAEAVASFPETFALRGWPADKAFRIHPEKSYMNNSDVVQLVLQTDCGDMGWLDFTRCSPSELRAQLR